MVIHYFGEGAFRLQSGEVSLLVDPTSTRLKADGTLRTLIPASVTGSAANEILFPGEYEFNGIEVMGFTVPAESTEKFLKTVYLVRQEDIQVALLGHLSKIPHAELMEKLGEPDVVILPMDGTHFLTVEDAVKLVKQLSPKLVIPSFSKHPAQIQKAFGGRAESAEKLVFRKKDLTGTQPRIVVLTHAS